MTSMTTEFLIQWSHTVFDVAGAIFVKENENIIKYELEIWDAVVALSLWDAEGIELGEAHTNIDFDVCVSDKPSLDITKRGLL